jgi:hypothetical protein
MRLSAPTNNVFYISVVLFILALIGHFVVIPYVTLYQFWIAIVAYVVLAIGNLFKGLRLARGPSPIPGEGLSLNARKIRHRAGGFANLVEQFEAVFAQGLVIHIDGDLVEKGIDARA